jgi:hypothetical protein
MSNPHGRDRNASNSPDQRHDTLNHMQKVENPNGKWEIEVPDGTYEVYVVAGDASYTDSVYKIAAEGSVVVSGTPNSWNRWFNGSATVTVTDGKLTISNASGSNNNKIDFIHITLVDDTPPAPEPEPAEEIDVKINFQNGSASVPNGYLKDSGSAFGNRGNGYTYGWNGSNDNGRDRNSWRSSSQKYDTLNHMQMGGNRFWEIAVPNGTYEVRIVAGDPDYTDSVYKIKVEGTTAISGTPSWSKRWFEKTLEVEVTDGKLTISNAWGASNNKISFVEITTAD